MKCPECGAVNVTKARFCIACGTSLRKGKEEVPSATKTIHAPQFVGGETFGKYKILEEIGRGGMGIVYKAKDTRLDRFVALKFLPPELTQDEEARKRFIREAKSAASLDHPNICSVFEVYEVEGRTFIAMPHIEGQSLKDRLRSGPMETDEIRDITLQIAEGLKEAHAKGIIHRDIKPANIMITDKGQVRIMDFGLAKLTGSADLTRTNQVMGTPAYMSPEQLLGADDIDVRSDIYSLGCVIFEMLSGVPPFSGMKAQASISRRLTDPPPPLPNITPSVNEVLRRSLAPAPENRFPTVIALADALMAALCEPDTPEKSIVILPFENLSPDPDNAFFADGLTEELITDLSKVHALRVISRTSAMQFKGKMKGIPAIAGELNVRYVMEGSVRRAGNSLRITAQLIDAATDSHLWAEKYSGSLKDVFDLQERLSRQIVEALKLTLSPEEDRKFSERPIQSPVAYDCYLRAIQSMWQFTQAALARAVEHLEHGIRIEGNSAQLFGALAYVYYQHANIGLEPTDRFRHKAREHAERAIAQNPEASLAHLTLGLLRAFENPIEGIRSFRRALQADPANLEAMVWIVAITSITGKPKLARTQWEAARKIDPLHPMIRWLEGAMLMYEGKFEQAANVLQESLHAVRMPVVLWYLGLDLAYLGRFEEAGRLFDEAFEGDEGSLSFWICRIFSLGLRGERENAWQVLRTKLDPHPATRRDLAYSLFSAEAHAFLDDKEGALDWLERSVELGMINYPFLNEYDPLLEPLRRKPRFRKLMARVKKEWEEFQI